MKPLLNLTIQRKWLDMIASGEKREEYRFADNRQIEAVFTGRRGHESPFVCLRAGYRMDSESIVVKCNDISIRNCDPKSPFYSGRGGPNKEWGEWAGDHYVLHLGKVLKRGSYAECRAWMDGYTPRRSPR